MVDSVVNVNNPLNEYPSSSNYSDNNESYNNLDLSPSKTAHYLSSQYLDYLKEDSTQGRFSSLYPTNPIYRGSPPPSHHEVYKDAGNDLNDSVDDQSPESTHNYSPQDPDYIAGSKYPHMVRIKGKDYSLRGDSDLQSLRDITQESINDPSMGTYLIYGNLRDTFSYSINSEWHRPLPSLFRGALSSAGGIASLPLDYVSKKTAGRESLFKATKESRGRIVGGISRVTGIASDILDTGENLLQRIDDFASPLLGQDWTQPSWYEFIWKSIEPIVFNLTLDFIAVNGSMEDVITPITVLQKLSAPTFKNGIMTAPGYHPFTGLYDAWTQKNPDGSYNSIDPLDYVSNRNSDNSYRMDIEIGETLSFKNVIMDNINIDFNTLPSEDLLKFHRATVHMVFRTNQIITKDRISSIMKTNNYQQAMESSYQNLGDSFVNLYNDFTGLADSFYSRTKDGIEQGVEKGVQVTSPVVSKVFKNPLSPLFPIGLAAQVSSLAAQGAWWALGEDFQAVKDGYNYLMSK